MVSSQVFPRMQPLETFFASVGPLGVSKSSSLSLKPPILGETLLSRIKDLERALGAGGSSTFSTHQTANTSSVAPPYGGGQPPFFQQQSLAPAPAGAENLAATVAVLDTRLMDLQAEVTKFKKMSDDTIIKVHFSEFTSADSFAAWWKLNCVALDELGHIIANDVHLCFADALGLIVMAVGTHNTVTSDMDKMSFLYRAKQTGYATAEAAVLFQSIGKQLPLMFGKLTPNTSERILPLCLTFPSWDNQDGETLFVDIRKRDL